MLKATEFSKKSVFKWFYSVVNLNVDRKKIYFNPIFTSRLGFLLNTVYVLVKILFENKFIIEGNLFNFASEIDPNFALSSNTINFPNFDMINQETHNEMIETKKKTVQNTNFNLETNFFFIINSIFSLTIRNFESEYLNLKKKFNDFVNLKAFNDPLFKECDCLIKAYDAYIKNNEFCKYIFKFTNVNINLFMILNNSKYTFEYLKSKKTQDNTVLEDLINSMDNTVNKALSQLPLFLVQNVMNIFICLR